MHLKQFHLKIFNFFSPWGDLRLRYLRINLQDESFSQTQQKQVFLRTAEQRQLPIFEIILWTASKLSEKCSAKIPLSAGGKHQRSCKSGQDGEAAALLRGFTSKQDMKLCQIFKASKKKRRSYCHRLSLTQPTHTVCLQELPALLYRGKELRL